MCVCVCLSGSVDTHPSALPGAGGICVLGVSVGCNELENSCRAKHIQEPGCH